MFSPISWPVLLPTGFAPFSVAFVAAFVATFLVSLEATFLATCFAISKNTFTILNHFSIVLHGTHIVICIMTILFSDPSCS